MAKNKTMSARKAIVEALAREKINNPFTTPPASNPLAPRDPNAQSAPVKVSPTAKKTSKKRAADQGVQDGTPATKALKSSKTTKSNVATPPKKRKTGARYISTDVRSSLKSSKTDGSVIPEAIKSIVKEVEDGVFHFIYKIADLGIFHRLPWCVRDDVTEVIVRVSYLKGAAAGSRTTFVSFCVHLDGDEMRGPHTGCRSDRPWQGPSSCGRDENFLTYCLSCELYDFFSDPNNNTALTHVHELIKRLITSDPGLFCAVCKTTCETKCWRPRACEKEECSTALSKWPLGVRLSPLILDPLVLDLLLCCCMGATRKDEGYRGSLSFDQLLQKCPIAQTRLAAVIDSFPKLIKDKIGAANLVGKGKYAEDRRQLLVWLCDRFKGSLITAPSDAEACMNSRPTAEFILMNHASADYSKFKQQLASRGESHGSVVFHGTTATRAFSILTDALRSGRPLKGEAHGVYYAHEPNYSEDYMRGTAFAGWSHSELKNKMLMFGLELSGDEKPTRHSYEAFTMDERNVMIRYVFLIDAVIDEEYYGGDYWGQYDGECRPTESLAPRQHIEPTMIKTFRRIHSDTLVDPRTR